MQLFSHIIFTAVFEFLIFISTWKNDFKPSDSYTVVYCGKIS